MESWVVAGILAAALLLYAFNGKGGAIGRAIALFFGAVLAFFAAQAALSNPIAWIVIALIIAIAIVATVLKYRAKRRKQREDERKNGGNTNNFYFNHRP